MDPNLDDVSIDDLIEHFSLALQVRDKTSLANETVIRIRNIRRSLRSAQEANMGDETLATTIDELLRKISIVESEIYQVRNRSAKDKIAFPIKLNNRLSGLLWLLETGGNKPPESYYRVFEELSAELNARLKEFDLAISTLGADINQILSRSGQAEISYE